MLTPLTKPTGLAAYLNTASLVLAAEQGGRLALTFSDGQEQAVPGTLEDLGGLPGFALLSQVSRNAVASQTRIALNLAWVRYMSEMACGSTYVTFEARRSGISQLVVAESPQEILRRGDSTAETPAQA